MIAQILYSLGLLTYQIQCHIYCECTIHIHVYITAQYITTEIIPYPALQSPCRQRKTQLTVPLYTTQSLRLPISLITGDKRECSPNHQVIEGKASMHWCPKYRSMTPSSMALTFVMRLGPNNKPSSHQEFANNISAVTGDYSEFHTLVILKISNLRKIFRILLDQHGCHYKHNTFTYGLDLPCEPGPWIWMQQAKLSDLNIQKVVWSNLQQHGTTM